MSNYIHVLRHNTVRWAQTTTTTTTTTTTLLIPAHPRHNNSHSLQLHITQIPGVGRLIIQRRRVLRINRRHRMVVSHHRRMRQTVMGDQSRCGQHRRRQRSMVQQRRRDGLHHRVRTGRFRHNRIESVDGIGGVVDGASAAVRLDQRILALNGVTVARLVLLLVVTGHMVGDGVAELVVRMRIVGLGNGVHSVRNADGDRLDVNGGQEGGQRGGNEELMEIVIV